MSSSEGLEPPEGSGRATDGAGAPLGSGVAPEPPAQWRFHDFQRPRPLSERQLKALDSVHAKFARALSAALSAVVRARLQVDLSSVTQRAYFEFIRSLPNPTSLHLVYTYPQRVPLVLELSLGALFPLIERLLGGKGDALRQPSRPLTRIEERIAGILCEKVLGVLAEAWSQGSDFRLDLAEAEHNPLLMQIVGPTEPTLVLAFEITLGIRTGSLHLALPLRPFDVLISKLIRSVTPGMPQEGTSEHEKEKILRRISPSPLVLAAELTAIPLCLEDLLTLKPGDMIDTQISRGAEVSVLVDGQRLFRAVPASHGGRRVVKITRLFAE